MANPNMRPPTFAAPDYKPRLQTYDGILDRCCFAWNKRIGMPWRIMSIGSRDWSRSTKLVGNNLPPGSSVQDRQANYNSPYM
jgi:hypothetical protein